MFILSLETSCDESAAAIIEGKKDGFSVISSVVSSQVKLHAEWGGVVPNLAAREHLKNIMPVVRKALQKAKLTAKDIDLIAVTNGPGLIPALLIGVSTAKALSYLWGVPLVGIHHIEGHIYANFISEKIQNLKFPLLCLVVSGGHTQLILMKKHLSYQIVGETLDDAAGEAFDKVARILDLGYPGGPAVSAKAEEFRINNKLKNITATKYQLLDTPLPRPMINSGDFNFSFSGLKTAVLYKFRQMNDGLSEKEKPLLISELATEFQDAAVEVLVKKTISAGRKYKVKTIMLAGGVSANKTLRQKLLKETKKGLPGVVCLLPEIKYTGDNAAMIGVAAYFRYKLNHKEKTWKNNWKKLETDANLKISH